MDTNKALSELISPWLKNNNADWANVSISRLELDSRNVITSYSIHYTKLYEVHSHFIAAVFVPFFVKRIDNSFTIVTLRSQN